MRFMADESPVFDADNPVTRPYRRLWCAVLLQAYKDAVGKEVVGDADDLSIQKNGGQ